MSIATGIVLFVVGAILAFALNFDVGWINLQLVGYILMAAGVVGIIIGIVFLTRRRGSVSTTRSGVDPVSGERITRQTSQTDDPLI
jgi:hypothetical protein